MDQNLNSLSTSYLSNSIEFPDERSASDVPHSQSLRGNVEQGIPVSLTQVTGLLQIFCCQYSIIT